MKPHYRSIFLSDVHLGTMGCQAKQLQHFLKTHTCDYLFLVGDIIDFWALGRGSKFTNDHNAVVQQIIKMSRHNTKVIFIPGNHDEILREYVGMIVGNIQIHKDYVHVTRDGLKMYIAHGDEFDIVTRYHKWIAITGDVGYTILLHINSGLNRLRAKFGMGYWSLSAFVKGKVKQAVSFIGDYENNVVKHAKKMEVGAVLVGHIHHAEFKMIDDILYLNTGDWVESMTAIVEETDGQLKVLECFDTHKKSSVRSSK